MKVTEAPVGSILHVGCHAKSTCGAVNHDSRCIPSFNQLGLKNWFVNMHPSEWFLKQLLENQVATPAQDGMNYCHLKNIQKKKLLCSNQGFSLALFRRALCPLGALMGLPQIQYSKFLHLCNKCTTLATPQRSVFSWLCNCEAILYGVTLRNCGLVEPCPVLQRCRNLL